MYQENSEIVERILSKVIIDDSTPCWIYRGTLNKSGYGVISVKSKTCCVHRVMFESYYKAKIPKGLEVNHICYVRHCCNPAHLSLITHKQNVLLSEKYVATRTDRLENLLAASPELVSFGIAYFESTRLKVLLNCCQDNGNHVVEVLKGMQAVYPGRFHCQKVWQGKGCRPSVVEIRMVPSLIAEFASGNDDGLEDFEEGLVA